MKENINDLSCKILSQILIQHVDVWQIGTVLTICQTSLLFGETNSLYLQKTKHVFIMETIIKSPTVSEAIVGVEMAQMGQTVHKKEKKWLFLFFVGN